MMIFLSLLKNSGNASSLRIRSIYKLIRQEGLKGPIQPPILDQSQILVTIQIAKLESILAI